MACRVERAVARIVAAAIASIFLVGTARTVLASDELRGVIVSVLASQSEAVVRHEPFGGMPAMTMVFRVEPKESVERLHVGDRITGRADLTTDPARLDDIRIVGRDTGSAGSVFHNAQPFGAGNSLSGWGLFALILVILAGASWMLYRWARIIFVEEPAEKN